MTTVSTHSASKTPAVNRLAEPGTRLSILRPEWHATLVASGLEGYSDFLECATGEVVARTGTSETRRVVLERGPRPLHAYLKQYRYAGARWRHRFRRHKGEIEARNYRLMRERAQVPVPDVVAIGSRRAGLRLLDAFILTQEIERTSSLEAWWTRRFPTPGVPHPLRRELENEVLELVVRMHRVHFYHVDLQWRNLLIRETPNGPRLYVLDSSRGGLRRLPWIRWHARMRDLSSLEKTARRFLSRADRVRFVHDYVRRTGCRESPRKLITRILADRRRKDTVS